MATLLNYDLTTYPPQLEASPSTSDANMATLNIVATNPDPSSPVTLQGVSIALPVGPDADQLTSVTTSISPVPPAGWTLADTKPGAGQVEYVFHPQAGHGSVGADGLAFTFNAVPINTQPGTAEVTVTEGSVGDPQTQLSVSKAPNGWGEITFDANPLIVPYQGSTTLNWHGPAGTVENPVTYTIEYFDYVQGQTVHVPVNGQLALSNDGQYPAQGAPALQLTKNTIFYLKVSATFSGQPYSAQKSVSVTVETPPPSIKSFKAKPPTAYYFRTFVAGSYNTVLPPIELSWTTEHAQQCELSGAVNTLPPNGSYTMPVGDSQCTLTASSQIPPPAVRTIPVPLYLVATIYALWSETAPYLLGVTAQTEVPPNSTVLVELNVFGKVVQQGSAPNPTGEQVQADISLGGTFDQYDENAFLTFTCTGQTTFQVTYQIGPVA